MFLWKNYFLFNEIWDPSSHKRNNTKPTKYGQNEEVEKTMWTIWKLSVSCYAMSARHPCRSPHLNRPRWAESFSVSVQKLITAGYGPQWLYIPTTSVSLLWFGNPETNVCWNGTTDSHRLRNLLSSIIYSCKHYSQPMCVLQVDMISSKLTKSVWVTM